MTATPIPRLVLRMAAPTVVSMLVTSIYNMADTIFVSQLGNSASGAVGVVFSIMAVIQAVGFTLGMGAGSLVSRCLGRHDSERASRYASTSFFAALAFGLCLTVFGLLFLDPLMRFLGSTDTILPYARDYALYILLAAPVMSASFVLNNVLRAEGRAAFSMVGLTVGGVLNIILDPIFIFTLGLGTAGAAIATGLSQCIGFFIMLGFFLSGKAQSKLSLRRCSVGGDTLGLILKTGMPSFSRQGLASLASILLNKGAMVYGDAAVAAMTIVGRIFMVILSVLLGIGQGFQPVCGFNYGAGLHSRVRHAFRFTAVMGEVAMGSLAIIGFFIAPYLVGLFRPDPIVIEIGALAFRCQCVAMLFQPLSICSNMLFQSIGQSGKATLLACMRQGLYFIPLILILPAIPGLGLLGVQISQPIADLLSFVSTVPFLAGFFRRLPQDQPAASKP